MKSQIYSSIKDEEYDINLHFRAYMNMSYNY